MRAERFPPATPESARSETRETREAAAVVPPPAPPDNSTRLMATSAATPQPENSLMDMLDTFRTGVLHAAHVVGEAVYRESHADPSIVRGDDGYFYSMATNARYDSGQVMNVPTIRSRDLINWEFVGDAMPVRPEWVKRDMWAPDVQRTGDHFTMFYSGRDANGQMKIGYATSDTAAGPFTDKGVLVDKSLGNATTIDPYLHETADGRMYMYWGSGAALTAQELSMDAAGGMQMVGTPKQVITRNDADPWERILVEGAWVEEHDGEFFLYYSAGSWEDMHPGYAVFVARSDSPLGPFEKRGGDPIMRSSSDVRSPGHISITQDDAGQSWVLHHAWDPGADGVVDRSVDERTLMLQPLTYGEDGWPLVNGGRLPGPEDQPDPVINAPDARPTPPSGQPTPTPE